MTNFLVSIGKINNMAPSSLFSTKEAAEEFVRYWINFFNSEIETEYKVNYDDYFHRIVLTSGEEIQVIEMKVR